MTPAKFAFGVSFLVMAACGSACTDVGDNTALPTQDAAGDDSTVDTGLPGTTPSEAAASDAGAAEDATVEDAGMSEGGSSGAGEDSSVPVDSGPGFDAESGVGDSGGLVSSTTDSGGADSQTVDSSTVDSTIADSGGTGSSAVDSGHNETGAPDTGAGDATTDGSSSGPTPCTMAPCAAVGPNSVECDGNTKNNGVCTPTEALIVARDIKLGYITGGQPDTNNSCYECLVQNGGLDDDLVASDKGNECGDVPTSAKTLTGEAPVQACLDTLSCILDRACNTASPPAECLCGTSQGTACLTTGAANGPCLQNEINGLDIGTGTILGSLVEGDPTATQKAYTNKQLASGMANAIGSFGFSNCEAQCSP